MSDSFIRVVAHQKHTMKNHTRSVLAIVCIGALACLSARFWMSSPDHDEEHTNKRLHHLQADRDDTFTIVHFTDLHFGEHAESDNQSVLVMQSVLETEPDTDLVVFGGDQVSGYVLNNSRDVLLKWLESIKTVATLHIPFAAIFGNHDDQPFVTIPLAWRAWIIPSLAVNVVILVGSLVIPKYRKFVWVAITSCTPLAWMFIVGYPSTVMRRTIMHYEQREFAPLSHSLGLNGYSNYFLPITSRNKTLALVFFLDSGGGRLYEGYTDQQLEWVEAVTTTLYPGPSSIAFAHIPSFEFQNQEESLQCTGNEHTEPGEYTGWKRKAPMTSLAASGVKAVFFGHNHRNSHCCMPEQDTPLRLPVMCYGRHTGYGGYGHWTRGARVIQLNFSSDHDRGFAATSLIITTWLRMEDRTKRDTLVLFST